MLEYRGIASARRFLASATFRAGRAYRVVPARANGQPAAGLYLADPHAGVCRAYVLLVLTTAGDRIAALTGFTADVMTRFGLPRTLPATDRRTSAGHRQQPTPVADRARPGAPSRGTQTPASRHVRGP